MSTTPRRSEVPDGRLRTAQGAAYREAGRGETLLLIHGVGMRLEAWDRQVRALSQTHRVIAVDMPGHGGSARIADGSRLDGFVDWFGAVLDDLRLEAVNVAGHSMGALIAGGAAVRFGDRVQRVALLNGVHRRSPEASAAVVARAGEIARGRMDVDGPLSRWFGAGSQDSDAYRQTRAWLAGVDPKGYATAYAAFAHGDALHADDWPKVAAPALFLTGRDDPNSTPAMAELMAAAAPRGQAVVIEGHRHMVNLTAPDEVNRILADWLTRKGTPT